MANWVYLATAPDQTTAEIWIELLKGEGISAMIRPSDAVSFLGVSAVSCRLLTPEENVDRAREILGPEAVIE